VGELYAYGSGQARLRGQLRATTLGDTMVFFQEHHFTFLWNVYFLTELVMAVE